MDVWSIDPRTISLSTMASCLSLTSFYPWFITTYTWPSFKLAWQNLNPWQKIVHLCTKKNQHFQDLGFSPYNSFMHLTMARGKQPIMWSGSHQIMTTNPKGAFSAAWQSYHISLNSSLSTHQDNCFTPSLLSSNLTQLMTRSPIFLREATRKTCLPCALITNRIYHILCLPTWCHR